MDPMNVTLAIVVGTLAAIVYSLRVLVLMERRISRIEGHVESISAKILKEELKTLSYDILYINDQATLPETMTYQPIEEIFKNKMMV